MKVTKKNLMLCPNDIEHSVFSTPVVTRSTLTVDRAGHYVDLDTDNEDCVWDRPSDTSTYVCEDCDADAFFAPAKSVIHEYRFEERCGNGVYIRALNEEHAKSQVKYRYPNTHGCMKFCGIFKESVAPGYLEMTDV